MTAFCRFFSFPFFIVEATDVESNESSLYPKVRRRPENEKVSFLFSRQERTDSAAVTMIILRLSGARGKRTMVHPFRSMASLVFGCLVLSFLEEVTAFSALSFTKGKGLRPYFVDQSKTSQWGRDDVRLMVDGVTLLSQWDDSIEVETTYPVTTSNRTVERIEKFSRLPVWPVWNGVFLFFVSRVFGEEAAANLENAIGGRVCPNFFQSERTSPFIMLVHHRHSFAPWDPLRHLQRTFFPEGFPAHPHRGRCSFLTVIH